MSALRVTILVDNRVERPRLLAEHGWACWIETDDGRLLFDTGQGQVLAHNAAELGVPLETAGAIVLSHGHYDHTGHLHAMLDVAPQARVFAHPAALEPKYAALPGQTGREIGMPALRDAPTPHVAGENDQCDVQDARLSAMRRRITARLTTTVEPTQICAGVYATGQVPRVTDFEDTNGYFYLDAMAHRHDPLLDDQAIFARTSAGTVVVLGCAHAGVINTLLYIRKLTDDVPIRAVLGGMHLFNASAERMSRTIAALRELEIPQIICAHCTGPNSCAALRHALGEGCTFAAVGQVHEWD